MKRHLLAALVIVACKQSEPPPARETTTAAATPASGAPQAPADPAARNYLNIVGSSTVYPFSTVVAEQFGKTTQFKAPKVESTGTGGGFKLFCAGVGAKHPDIVNASRRIKPSEVAECAKNGAQDIVELKIGYDGIVLANSRRAPQLQLGLRQLWLALAKEVPDGDSQQTKPNPYSTWKDVDPRLPAEKIEVLGPPPTSGTRDAFVELGLEGGCNAFEWIKALKTSDEKRHKALCQTVREDGAFIEAGENDNLIVQKLAANPAAFGIFGFSFLEQNSEKVQGSLIDGVAASVESISKGSYPLSRPLYVYVKKAHVGVVPGLAEYLAEFTSPRAWGPEGYLEDKGMIALPDEERAKYQNIASKLEPLQL